MRIRTGYSFRAAVGKLEAVAEAMKAAGYPAMPITDRNSAFGWTRWSKLVERPIFGMEIGVSPNPHAKRPIVSYWTFIPRRSLQDLAELFELAQAQFRYEPLLTYEQAMQARDMLVMAGEGAIPDEIRKVDAPSGLYWACGPGAYAPWAKEMQALGLRPLLTNNNFWPAPGDRALYETIVPRPYIAAFDQSVVSLAALKETTPDLRPWIDEAQVNLERELAAEWPGLEQGQLVSPPRSAPLVDMCRKGALKLGINLDSQPEYAERLERELSVIEQKGFEDYFYILAELCTWSRERMLVGPARGSSAGSLVCYLLGITTVDPIPNGLIFERFIDLNRPDLPDIDVDFNDRKRHLAIEHLQEVYGQDRVARLGTVSYYQAKSALGEAAKALKIPRYEVDKLDTSNGLKVAVAESGHPELKIALEMEGHPRHHSQHAAGVIITREPVHAYVPIDARTGGTHCDKYDAESRDLLKLDALGLTQLSILQDALELAELPHTAIFDVPLDVPEAYEVMNAGKLAGVFQFNGQTLRGLAERVQIESIEDITALTAIARPGPLHSGAAERWIRRRNSADFQENQRTYLTPELEPILNETLGEIVYQEQVMRIAREIAGMDWPQVAALRKAIAKSKGREALAEYEQAFLNGCGKPQFSAQVAQTLWQNILEQGAYAFNKSHAYSYAVVSYWCAWAKAMHPLEYAVALLNHESDPARMIELLRELDAEGISYIPADLEHSTGEWQIVEKNGEKTLLGPLTLVKGIGPSLMGQIELARRMGKPLPGRAQKLLAKGFKTEIDTLWPIGDAFKRLLPDLQEANIFTPPIGIGTIPNNRQMDNVVLFVQVKNIRTGDENESERVERRGYRVKGATTFMAMTLMDDTGEIYGKIHRADYNRLSRIFKKHGPGLYVVKGNVPDYYRMVWIKRVKYVGKT